MDLNLTNKTALVTGASSGIGAGIAIALAAEGANVAMVARRKEQMEEIGARIVADGGNAPHYITADITNREDIARVVKEANEQFGEIDILVNAAGGSRPTVIEAPEDVWDEAFEINFTASRRLTESVLPGMRARKWGRVINISGSMEPRALNAATAAKGALHLWAKGISCNLASEGITVNCIAPGRINSEQILTKLYPTEESREKFIKANIPIGYFGEPQDLACVAVFLASPIARYVTGAVIPVDGGMHYFAH